uniref:Sushi domain-containing protein n=1 Tax=Anabas testudineus TaxID=64144 RepID=A0AAQ6IG79_ANATE
MQGEPFKTCNNGRWTGSMRCLRPCTVNRDDMYRHNIRFTHKTDDKLYSPHEDHITFSCIRGTVPDGRMELRQQCNDACSNLPDVPHAQVSEDTKKAEYQEGDVIHFTCETGYQSDQTSKYVCTRGGWLAVRQGTCYSCSTLPQVHHARISEETRKTEYQQGHVIEFTCDPGYKSSLTIKYACTSGGWLAISGGSCTFLTSGCEPPPVDGGFIVKGLPENNDLILPDHVLTFSCEDGKYLNGTSLLICGEDGQWTSPFPSCNENCRVTEIPGSVRLTTRHVAGSQLRAGEKLRFDCRQRNHIIHGNEEVECLANGQWSEPFPTCGPPVGCGKPPTLPDGDLKYDIKFSYVNTEKVEYICQLHYTMKGEPFKTCNNGRWTGSMRCLRPCTVNRDDMYRHNIRFTHKTDDKLYSPHGDHITFSCIRGTVPDGRLEMRQQCNDGVMNLPTCVPRSW